MPAPTTHTATELQIDHGRPRSLHWHGERWRVLDTPTLIGVSRDAASTSLLTHPPTPWTGWRFIASSDTSPDSLIFDVRQLADGSFEVLSVRA